MNPAAGRPASGDDVVLGMTPAAVVEPATLEETVEVVGEAARGRKNLLFVGGGTDLELGVRPERLDVLLRTRRLDRIVEHAPSDQIVVVEAGVTLAALGRVLASAGQRLALDPPLPERATVGGVVAANAFGPRRARYGSVRDLIIGVSIVRADGVRASGGGKVVKNVAGFDLPKLMVGSLGTLGLVASATFRLHPIPEDSATLLSSGLRAADVVALVGRIRETQLEVDSVVAFRTGPDRFDVAVRFEGFSRGVADQRLRLAALAGSELRMACDALDRAAAEALWSRHDAARRRGTLRAKVAALPSRFDEVERRVLAPLSATLESPECVWYPTLGLGFLGGDGPSASAAIAAVDSARSALAERGGTLVVLAAPESVRPGMDVWGPPPPAAALMHGVKNRFDPDRRLSPGRFVGEI